MMPLRWIRFWEPFLTERYWKLQFDDDFNIHGKILTEWRWISIRIVFSSCFPYRPPTITITDLALSSFLDCMDSETGRLSVFDGNNWSPALVGLHQLLYNIIVTLSDNPMTRKLCSVHDELYMISDIPPNNHKLPVLRCGGPYFKEWCEELGERESIKIFQCVEIRHL
jgi:hypothetical protein